MASRELLDLAAGWRIQRYGRRGPNRIDDPIVEPYWGGARVLVAIDDDGVAVFHAGERVNISPVLAEALSGVLLAADAVIEGHLTPEALNTGVGARLDDRIEPIRPLRMIAGALMPGGGRRDQYVALKQEEARTLEREMTALATVEGAEGSESLAFVVTDLLWLDGQSLLDVPLLERKRLLEATIGEEELVRRTAYVRPTARPSLVAWHSLGFTELAWKAANSRYRPGEVNDGWTVSRSPSGKAPGGR
jgi:ATP-dependent DNA ligase